MPIGTIEMISEKGYGFITSPDGQQFYFHATSCGDLWKKTERKLDVGTRVEFETQEIARNIQLL